VEELFSRETEQPVTDYGLRVGALGIRDLGLDPATKTVRLNELNTEASTSLTLDNFDRYVSLDADVIRLQDGLKQLLHGEVLATARLARLTSAWRSVELRLKEQKAAVVLVQACLTLF
jgi:hypothetical protein